ncbi:MAG: AAA family ATPase [Bacteroidetes bacterium]|nr:AAA family ATPase [Bacteroidota bacterium]
MAQRIEEDIFNDDAIEIVIRFEGKAIQNLDNQNNGNFEDFKKWISDNQYQCFFSKKNDDEHKLLILIEDENKNIELTLKWQPKTFDYKAVVNKKSKRIIQDYKLLENDKYSILEECILTFIDFNASNFPSKEQKNLYDNICKLEISPKSNIENQQEIWGKWIEAQQLILDKNSQPIEIVGYQQPDISTTRLQFKTKLKQKENPEYDALEEALKEEPFQINEKFDGDVVFLKHNDIFKGVDKVISKDFSEIFERNIKLVCILKIRPFFNSQLVKNELDKINWNLFVRNGIGENTIEFYNSSDKIAIIPKEIIKKFNLQRAGLIGRFSIINKNGLPIKDNITKKIRTNSTFAFVSKTKLDFKTHLLKKRKNLFDDGAKSVKFNLGEVYTISSETNIGFDEEFWNDLQREFHDFEFDLIFNDFENIAFEFENKEELEYKFNIIKSLNRFDIVKSPLDIDFKFKVKIELITKKSKKQEFLEKIKTLSGVEFQLDKGDKFDFNKRHLVIGNLAARNSNLNNLVFNLPYKWKDEKKQTDKFLKYIDEEPKINKVIPNLRGDQAKISWLNEAMNKVNNPQEGLDSKPVNERLKEFVFDSSKAEDVFRDLSEDTEDWNELKRHELLILNNSQRRAILSALYTTDLALLQGPPGTGKTTVIAEMIWQMVRTNQEQKVLLTSETNLAVDNALEKLLNKDHTLVKPIRFGRASKFEEEGKKYSFERITKWIDNTATVDDIYENETIAEDESNEEIIYEDYNNNAVQLWMRRIADNSQQTNPKYAEVMKDWAFEMAQPRKEMKELFRDKYFKYCNVVGSTSSSAGSPRFGADYQSIFNNDYEGNISQDYKYLKKKLRSINNFGNTRTGRKLLDSIKSIEFDTVITDEASKATPPELLLPMCFGKKNVIIGDHRQLPPMLHDKSFKEVLETLETKEALELSSEIDKEFVETSQFERLISHPDVSPTIKSTFNEQYRMHPKINNVIKQFYLDEGGLEPGKPILENADDTDLNNPFSRHHGLILKDFINPDIHTIWVNVDDPEELSGTSRINPTEVEAVGMVLKLLKQSNGFSEYMNHWDNLKDENKRREEQEIGLISFYGHQVGKLKEIAKYSGAKLDIPIRLNTVDKFQGMERNIIIVSTVRSDKKIENGITKPNRDIGFAKSPQRLNVALSRAKRLLIVVGNKNFFSQYKNKEGERIYQNVIDIIQKEGLVIDFKELKKKFGDDK